MIVARAPGRVNLIGDHTDYTGGFCLPMAIDRRVEIVGERDPRSTEVRLTSESQRDDAIVTLSIADPRLLEPEWARYVGGVVAELRPANGFVGTVTSTVPAGSGLSSSAALEAATALALGADIGDPIALARLCQAAEHRARGVPTGLLDQLASIGGLEGRGLLIDCTNLTLTPVDLPAPDEAVWLVILASSRSLADSGYSRRVQELAAAEAAIGPLRWATRAAVESLDDPIIQARARHVLTENARVLDFAAAISAGDLRTAGSLMFASHNSLSGDFDCSTSVIDRLCEQLQSTPGVYGARMTGGGWGGCVVTLARPGALAVTDFDHAWFVRPAVGATVEETD